MVISCIIRVVKIFGFVVPLLNSEFEPYTIARTT